MPDALAPHDAVLVVSFGGPEGPDEVLPFLRRVTAGRGIPDERLALVAEHYLARGGISPLPAANRALVAALTAELSARGIPRPVLLGNRNAPPFLVDTLREAHEAGRRRLAVVLTAAYSCYSSCRQYREDLAAALAELADEGREITVEKIRPYATTEPYADLWARLIGAARFTPDTRLLAVTHSVPEAMDELSGPGDGEGHLYVDQHLRLLRAVVERLGIDPAHAELVFCSRSGPPSQPWLEPDVNDRLRELAAEGVTEVVLAPLGFTADHMEVVQDLDTEATATAVEVGLRVQRVPTPGLDPAYIALLVDLLVEQATGDPARQVPDLPGDRRPAICAAGCCPNLRAARPAVCGGD